MKTPSPSQLRLAADIIENNLEWEVKGKDIPEWTSLPNNKLNEFAFCDCHEIRIKPTPDKWAAEKAAFAEGKVIQYRNKKMNPSREWEDSSAPSFFKIEGFEYRIKPWTHLKEVGYEILRPGSTWMPCSKEVDFL